MKSTFYKYTALSMVIAYFAGNVLAQLLFNQDFSYPFSKFFVRANILPFTVPINFYPFTLALIAFTAFTLYVLFKKSIKWPYLIVCCVWGICWVLSSVMTFFINMGT